MCVCVCVLFQILVHCRVSQDIEYSSLCYTVGPCWSISLLLLMRWGAFSSRWYGPGLLCSRGFGISCIRQQTAFLPGTSAHSCWPSGVFARVSCQEASSLVTECSRTATWPPSRPPASARLWKTGGGESGPTNPGSASPNRRLPLRGGKADWLLEPLLA